MVVSPFRSERHQWLRATFARRKAYGRTCRALPAAALTDVVLLDDDWRELIEFGAAMRIASNLRMLDYSEKYHTMLYGDPKKKELGLYTARISQLENDIVSNQGMRQLRPVTAGRWV